MATPFIHRITKALGWHAAAPVNKTREEKLRDKRKQRDMVSQMTRFRDSTGLSSDPLSRSRQLAEMSESDTIQPIIELYTEEATQPDITKRKSIWYTCSDKAIEKKLNDMLEQIDVESVIQSIVSGVAGRGGQMMRVLYNTQQGVVGLVHPDTPVRRLFDRTTKVLLGFLWEGQQPDSPFYDTQREVFAPWDFIHFRRMMGPNEYGQGMLEHLYRIWKRLEMSLDQMAIYRLHTSPNRLAVEVFTGSQDVTSQANTIHLFREMMRSQIGLDNDRMSSEFNPPALESVLFIPKGDNETHSVQTLQGDKDVPKVYDIETLTKFLYGGARVPKAYLGHGDDSGNGLAKSSLVTQDIRFARMIRTLRRPIVNGFQQLATFHLAFLGLAPENYKVEVEMSRISSIEEEVNAEVVERQANAARTIVDLLQLLNVPNKETIELVFTEYLKLPRDFVELAALAAEMRDAAGIEGEGGGMGGGGGGMGGFGGGGGDFGGEELDSEALGSELGGGGGSPVGAFGADDFDIAEPKAESKSREQLQRLHESRKFRAFSKRLVESVRVSRKTLTESLSTSVVESITAADRSLTEALSKLRSVSVDKKVSLVESYSKEPGLSGMNMLVESINIKRPTAQLSEMFSGQSSATLVDVSSPEAVRIVKRMRNSKTKVKK